MTSRRWLLILLLGLPLAADGLEVALGMAVGPTSRTAAPYSGNSTTGLQIRAGWDSSLSYTRIDQWQALAQRGSNENLDYDIAGAGWQRSWWTERHGAQVALGVELRGERYQGKDSLVAGPSPLPQDQAWIVRPWIRGQVGFRGILIPLPEPGGRLLGWLTQGGRYSHPFTRLEVAVPLWHQGGGGPQGLLRRMAPRWEACLQFGMRFGGMS
ncbi:MAG: hypothetical protein Q8K67_04075 [Geothrix sp.]|nr:hypothetical protein [Geothrix sp.]